MCICIYIYICNVYISLYRYRERYSCLSLIIHMCLHCIHFYLNTMTRGSLQRCVLSVTWVMYISTTTTTTTTDHNNNNDNNT